MSVGLCTVVAFLEAKIFVIFHFFVSVQAFAYGRSNIVGTLDDNC